MTDTDRPVYVAVRYIHHDGTTAEPAPGTMTPKEIVDRAMHPSVASTTIWCPGVDPEPGPTDLDVESAPAKFAVIARPSSDSVVSAWARFNQSRSNVVKLTPGQLQQRWDDHYRRGMDDDYPEGGDDVA